MIVVGDEASLYLQATLQVVWAPIGETPVVKVDPGREHMHFYGALHLQTGQEIVMRSPIMNGATSVLFLHKLVAAYPHQPILLLWDRSPWHQGPAIRQFLADHPAVEIFAVPPGSPDLNPQEHVWKATREAVSHNHIIKKLDRLADQFEAHLTGTAFVCSLLDRLADQFEAHLTGTAFVCSLLEQHDDDHICAMFI